MGAGSSTRALCVNVLESVEDPKAVIESLRGCLKPGGNLIVLVPQGQGLFGSLDQAMGTSAAFPRSRTAGHARWDSVFRSSAMHQLNKIGALSWWIFGKLLGRKANHRSPALKLFDKTVWFWRRVDGLLPWRGLISGGRRANGTNHAKSCETEDAMSKYVVTGGAGFIGSTLVRTLLDGGGCGRGDRQPADRPRAQSRGGSRANRVP